MDTARAETYYFKELERRKDLDSAPTFRVAILGLIAGAFSYFCQHLMPDGGWHAWFFLFSFAVVIICAALSVIWMIRLFVGFEWGYMPAPKELSAHYAALQKYEKEYGFEHSNAETEFDLYLRERYVEAATLNVRNNNARSELLYRASFFLAVAVLFTLVAGIPVLSWALEHSTLITQGNIIMADEKPSSSPSSGGEKAPAPKPAPPQGPPITVVKGGRLPGETVRVTADSGGKVKK